MNSCTLMYILCFWELDDQILTIRLMLVNHVSCRKYGLEDDTIHFIGHALGLHLDDSYLDHPALDFVKRMKVHLQFFEILFSTRLWWLHKKEEEVIFKLFCYLFHKALCRVIGTFSRRITLYLSTLWTSRIASGLLKSITFFYRIWEWR
jgi:hypothetical protein